jgi:hydrogenase maturation protease
LSSTSASGPGSPSLSSRSASGSGSASGPDGPGASSSCGPGGSSGQTGDGARPRVLIAGVGNIFLGDDGFGSEVARALLGSDLPAQIIDYGIRGTHLAYDLLDGYDALILIDLLPDGAPGAVRAIEVDTSALDGASVDGHAMDPRAVLSSLKAMGGALPRVVVIGCAPVTTDEQIGLSHQVVAAVPDAIALTHRVLRDLLSAAPAGQR